MWRVSVVELAAYLGIPPFVVGRYLYEIRTQPWARWAGLNAAQVRAVMEYHHLSRKLTLRARKAMAERTAQEYRARRRAKLETEKMRPRCCLPPKNEPQSE